MNPSWGDIQNFCDDLSKWIIETDTVEEVKIAYPKGTFPLKVDPTTDEQQECWDILVYMTLWICCKKHTKAPHYLESRIFFSERYLKGPWAKLYVKLLQRGFTDPEDKWADIFYLAS